jgi:tRNA A-37 threonylcarbamoyl transferase component Bud32
MNSISLPGMVKPISTVIINTIQIVMPVYTGLCEYVKIHSQTDRQADIKSVFSTLVVSLSTLHYNGMMHGDLYVKNIVVEHGVAKLIDWGGCIMQINDSVWNSTSISFRAPELMYNRYRNDN